MRIGRRTVFARIKESIQCCISITTNFYDFFQQKLISRGKYTASLISILILTDKVRSHFELFYFDFDFTSKSGLV